MWAIMRHYYNRLVELAVDGVSQRPLGICSGLTEALQYIEIIHVTRTAGGP